MKLLTRNLGWKLLSLAIAFALWVAVAREPELATSLSVPLEFKNLPDELDASTTNTLDRVRIEVRGPSGRLSPESLRDSALVLDLSDARPGERTYTIQPSNAKLPSGVSFYKAVPSQVTVRFDHLMLRQVPVQPYLKHPPDGYQIKSFTFTPERVNLRGPEDRLKNISRVMTDPVELGTVVGEAEFRTHVNVGDPQVRLDVPTPITLKVTLEKIDAKDKR
jgi:YbbR domain-containing protein